MTGAQEALEEEPDFSDDDAWLREVARAPFAPLPDLLGEHFGRYRVDRVLGAGGMGVVYLAEDEQLGRTVALKVLPSDRFDDDDRRKRFIREARLAAQLSHPSIATIYDAGEIGERAFLAMEYVPGVSLREKLKDGPLDTREVTRIGKAIASGLAVAHAANIIHRDIKPENVIVGAGDVVKVLDFGAAKLQRDLLAGTSSADTGEGRIIGTPAYMSPEQAKGGRIDARSDVFSFGILLYEMTTGRRPFGGRTSLEVLVAIDRDEPEPVSREAPALAAIIHRCLEKDPAKRVASAAELASKLQTLLDAPARSRSSAAFITRPRIAIAVAALACTVAIPITALRRSAGDRSTRAASPAISASAFAETNVVSASPELAVSPSSSPTPSAASSARVEPARSRASSPPATNKPPASAASAARAVPPSAPSGPASAEPRRPGPLDEPK
jgi:serine/threonine-protein kinase